MFIQRCFFFFLVWLACMSGAGCDDDGGRALREGALDASPEDASSSEEDGALSLDMGRPDEGVDGALPVDIGVGDVMAPSLDAEVVDMAPPDAFTAPPPGSRPVVFTRDLPIEEIIGQVQVGRRGDLWVVDVEAPEGARPLLVEEAAALMPSWSPDGRAVVFASNRGGDFGVDATPELDLWVLSVETGALRQLTDLPGHEWTPAWSPDGRHIAFAATRDYPEPDNVWGFDVWVVDVEGQRPRPVHQGRSQDEDPVFAPDNRTLYFMVDASEPGCFFQIWQADIDEGIGSARVVVDGQGQKICGEDPSVSPDGAWLYFSHRGQWRRLALEGGRVEDVAQVTEPWIGPEGGRYVYMAEGAIWLGEIDGEAPRALTEPSDESEAPDSFPRW